MYNALVFYYSVSIGLTATIRLKWKIESGKNKKRAQRARKISHVCSFAQATGRMFRCSIVVHLHSRRQLHRISLMSYIIRHVFRKINIYSKINVYLIVSGTLEFCRVTFLEHYEYRLLPLHNHHDYHQKDQQYRSLESAVESQSTADDLLD